MLKKVGTFIWFLLFCFSGVIAQESWFNYNFDDCTFEDSKIQFPGITPGGSPACECGLNMHSFKLDGVSDFLSISQQANVHLDVDFTLDFYFSLGAATGEIDILSHRNGCNNLDSLMTLRYFTSSNEILFEIASNVNNYNSVRAKLDPDVCWHRFTLVKFNLEYLVYLDNILLKRIISKETIELSRKASLVFANSPCVSSQSKKFDGKIDEIRLYKRALSELELYKLFIFPDQIETPNTTIFKGESISLILGTTCANSINWSPSVGLDDINSLTPIATPDVSTTYKVNLDNGNCLSTDTVRIFVADKNKLDCDILLLPKAFTPNNDGLNDRFGISNTFLVDKLVYFDIYSRSGSIIWETKELNDTWDGTFNNQPVNGGTYLVKIKYVCNGQEKFYIDNFILLR